MQQSTISLIIAGLYILSLVLISLLLVFKFKKVYRIIICGIALFTLAFIAGIAVAVYFNFFAFIFAFISIYQLLNILRIALGRMNEEYLYRVARRTFVYLSISQLLLTGIWASIRYYDWQISNGAVISVLSYFIFVMCLLLALTTLINLYRYKPKKTEALTDNKLPTLTLAIAARNENLMLKDCLDAAIESKYPKLEILVLDDCSQDKSAYIIKSYAQRGVRFVQGGKEDIHWLAKNKAYQTLLDQSSGDLILFMGVDVILGQNTLNKLVESYMQTGANMISILPKRIKSGLIASFVQPMRYWWELAIPRQFLKRPPVLSTCWLINSQVLIKMGGFKSVTRAIIPEEHLAWEQAKIGKYKFFRNTSDINLTTQKDFLSQWSTALRTRYPQVHRRPEMVALRTLAMTTVLCLPFVYCIFVIFNTSPAPSILVLAICSAILLVASNVLISLATSPASTILAFINFPANVVLDLIALHVSMYRYEFGEVVWKGRNVSNTAMHVYKQLPKI